MTIECISSFAGVYSLTDPTKAWPVSYTEVYGIETDRFISGYYVTPRHWSKDGRYLYLSIRPCCLDGGCSKYGGGESLVRLDLTNGRVTFTLHPGGDDRLRLYTFSFSDDDRYLAYLRTWLEHPILNIQDLVTGEEVHIPLGEQFDEAGGVVWSPDKSRIVFSARTGEDCDNMVNYLVMMKLEDQSQTILLESTTDDYTPVEWTEENEIMLYLGYGIGYGVLDLATYEITPYLTPTPGEVP
jgi:Tol biopolymer transport system component